MSAKDLYTLMSDGRLIRSSELSIFGIHRVSLTQLESQKKIERVSRGVYIRSDIVKSKMFAHCILSLRIPQGVFGLDSALMFHDMTPVTGQTWIRLCKGKKKYPKIDGFQTRYITRSPFFFERGIITTKIHGVPIRYTDLAHTVAECVVFRKRFGISNMLKVLMEYLKHTNGETGELLQACRVHRVDKVIQPYMESCVHLLRK